jgi:Ser/Thr protein kinase RdoA (MazF antagonist)
LHYYGPKLYVLRPGHFYHHLKSRHRRPQADLASIREVLAEYELELSDDLPILSGQGRSQSLFVSTSSGKKMLKRYKRTVIKPAIAYEHSVLRHLAEINFPAPRLVVAKTGATWVARQEDHYALFDFIEGGFQYSHYILWPWRSRHFISIGGKLLAELHAELQDFTPQGYNPNGFRSPHEGRWRDLEWFVSKLQYCVAKAPQLNANTGNLGSQFLGRARQLEQALLELESVLTEAALPRLVIHGDYGPANLLFRHNAPVVVIDFEIARLDWRLTELVDALWRFGEDRFLGFRIDKMKVFLDAYQTHLPLASQELRFLPAVWKYLHIRRFIVNWHRYCSTLADRSLARAQMHLKLIDWMTAHQQNFMPV